MFNSKVLYRKKIFWSLSKSIQLCAQVLWAILNLEIETQKIFSSANLTSVNRVWMNSVKVVTVKKWSRSQNKKDVQFFIGFVNFYRQFIADFLKIVTSLTALTGSNLTWEWTDACKNTFENLKIMFCITLILALFNFKKNCIVKINTFNHVFTEVLFQKNSEGHLSSVVYFFKKHSFTECNYKIYNKKLLAVILAF